MTMYNLDPQSMHYVRISLDNIRMQLDYIEKLLNPVEPESPKTTTVDPVIVKLFTASRISATEIQVDYFIETTAPLKRVAVIVNNDPLSWKDLVTGISGRTILNTAIPDGGAVYLHVWLGTAVPAIDERDLVIATAEYESFSDMPIQQGDTPPADDHRRPPGLSINDEGHAVEPDPAA